MKNLKPILNIPDILYKKGVINVVISAGSRSAPLTLSFIRYKKFNINVVIDERSAAFIALGLSQSSNLPTVLICTSGSAVLNYAPAIAEAYYQKIPLLVLTADRPPETIDQFDNQCIRQKNIYSNYCNKSFELPSDYSAKESEIFLNRIISEAFEFSLYPSKGPVHINIPLREPIYPSNTDTFIYPDIKTRDFFIPKIEIADNNFKIIKEKLFNYSKIIVFIGQNRDEKLAKVLKKLAKISNIIVIAEITSNIYDKDIITYSDLIINTVSKVESTIFEKDLINEEFFKRKDLINQENLAPELLITCGDSILSKTIKRFFNLSNIQEHWHIQEDNFFGDTLNSITKVITSKPELFFEKLIKTRISLNDKSVSYKSKWLYANNLIRLNIEKKLENISFSDLYCIYKILKNLPQDSILHLGNSTPVRYANYISMANSKKNIKVFSNRGTSGIDGIVSTAVGTALQTDKIVTLLVGDLSFFYDRNALWNNYVNNLKNLRIIVLNNHGGQIFRMVEGSSKLPELPDFFETKNTFSIKNTIKDTNFKYFYLNSKESFDKKINSFFKKSNYSKIMEIELDSDVSMKAFNSFLGK